MPSAARRRPTAVSSFDVFETVLFRTVGHHSTTYLLLGRLAKQRGLCAHDTSVLAAGRREAEVRARRRAGVHEIHLAEIHEELADAFGYGNTNMSHMMNLELEIEARVTRSSASAKRLVGASRASGSRIVFVSDTYLPASFIRFLLEEQSLLLPSDGLYVSSASIGGATKASGLLFKQVVQEEALRPQAIVHTGDSWRSDVVSARRNGFRARFFELGQLNRYERALERYSDGTGGLTSMMAGASRLARLDAIRVEDPRDQILRDVAASVIAPVVVGFVLWLFECARRDGIERLYFLAREGQVLYEVANQLRGQLGLSTELKYLHVSRQSLNIAAARDLTTEELSWVLTHSESNSIRTILERLGNTPDAIAADLCAEGWGPESWDQPIGTARLPELFATLRRPDVRRQLEAGIANARQLAVEYLDQEGVFDRVQIGLVDSTGGGSQLRAIERLRRDRAMESICGYLIYRGTPAFSPGPTATRIRGWFGDEVRRQGYGATSGRSELLEVICAADHGTTLGYQWENGQICAKLNDGQANAVIDWGLPLVRATIARFVREICLEPDLVDLGPDTRPAINEIMAMLWNNPTQGEARVWGRFPFEPTSGRSDRPVPLASPYSLGEVAVALWYKELRNRTWFRWPAASEKLSGPVAASAIRLARFAKKAPAGQLRRLRDLWVGSSWRTTN